MKYEDVYLKSYKDIQEARKGIETYMNIYNKERLHFSIYYMTLDEAYYKGANNKSYNARKMILGVG